MIQEVLDLLPSADLRAKIKETNHTFQENELLQIIYRYAPTFDRRIDLLKRFSAIASPDTAALAKVYIQYEQENFSRFLDASERFVYELCIKETPNSYEEKYLCSSYQAALVCIDRFYEAYAGLHTKENKTTRYTIVKRKIFSENDTFNEDVYGECVLGPQKAVKEITLYNNPANCDLDTMCDECNEICPYRCDRIRFPCFVPNYSIIKYQGFNGNEQFSVNLCEKECDGFSQELYAIRLDSSAIREHRFDVASFDHDHPELPYVSLVTPSDLDDTMRKDYFDFVAYWKSLETEPSA